MNFTHTTKLSSLKYVFNKSDAKTYIFYLNYDRIGFYKIRLYLRLTNSVFKSDSLNLKEVFFRVLCSRSNKIHFLRV